MNELQYCSVNAVIVNAALCERFSINVLGDLGNLPTAISAYSIATFLVSIDIPLCVSCLQDHIQAVREVYAHVCRGGEGEESGMDCPAEVLCDALALLATCLPSLAAKSNQVRCQCAARLQLGSKGFY